MSPFRPPYTSDSDGAFVKYLTDGNDGEEGFSTARSGNSRSLADSGGVYRAFTTAFDSVVLYQDQCQRGRKDGEVIALLREGLEGASRTREVCDIDGEFVAIDHALERLQSGDLCLILIDQVEEALAHIGRRVAESSAG